MWSSFETLRWNVRHIKRENKMLSEIFLILKKDYTYLWRKKNLELLSQLYISYLTIMNLWNIISLCFCKGRKFKNDYVKTTPFKFKVKIGKISLNCCYSQKKYWNTESSSKFQSNGKSDFRIQTQYFQSSNNGTLTKRKVW